MVLKVIDLLFLFQMYLFMSMIILKVGLYRLLMESWLPCHSGAVMLHVSAPKEDVTWGQSFSYCVGHSRFPLTCAWALALPSHQAALEFSWPFLSLEF